MNTLQHMTMVATTYQTSHECSEETIIDILVAGFSRQLKGWWDNYLTNDEKSKIYSAVKTDLNGKVITNENNKEIPDVVNTLILHLEGIVIALPLVHLTCCFVILKLRHAWHGFLLNLLLDFLLIF